MLSRWTFWLALITASAASVASAANKSGPTPPRVSFIDGEVSFWRPGADDWAPAQVNTALAEGDSLYAGDNGNLELEVGSGTFVRAGSGTEIGLDGLDPDLVQFKATSGHVALDARRLPKGRAIELDTPNAAFTMDQPGYYRVDVDKDRTTFITREGGRASMIPASGDETDVGPDQQVVLSGTDNPEATTGGAAAPDDWDRWNLDRTRARPEHSASEKYVPQDVAGTDELDRHGEWHDTPQYGHVWVPSGVAPDWSPYSTGRWVWDPYYGWTWVDDAPWGWAPYHYGRWVYTGGFWGWAPGPVVVAPVYAPALVAFFGPVSVAIGAPFPLVSWVPLGWGEPCVPWWGGVGFVGHAWWGGWGGPRVVNNVVIQRNTYVNVRNVTVYKNVNVRNGVVAARRDRFGQGRVEHVRLNAAQARNLRPVHGQIPVRPTAASLVPREGRGVRPPDAGRARPVVATREPRDPARRLQRAGLEPNARTATPPVRVVQPRERQGAPGGARHAGRAAAPGVVTSAPPPPPHGHAASQGAVERHAPAGTAERRAPGAGPQQHHPASEAPRAPRDDVPRAREAAPAGERRSPHSAPEGRRAEQPREPVEAPRPPVHRQAAPERAPRERPVSRQASPAEAPRQPGGYPTHGDPRGGGAPHGEHGDRSAHEHAAPPPHP
jgi:hypothetical protein